MDLADAKQSVRLALRARRKPFHALHAAAAAEAFADQYDAHFRDLPGPISAYWPMQSELDVRPLMLRLATRRHILLLPVIDGRGLPLRFEVWRPDAQATGEFIDPVTLLVPLLGFDRSGARLGQGAGYYDRTLAGLRMRGPITALGVCYSIQEWPGLPVGEMDQPLDGVLTEAGPVFMGGI